MLPDPDLSPPQCLDALEASLKSLLLRTGSALSEPTNFDATNITLTKDRVRRTLPPTLETFHRALGDLELALIRAKSALHRDFNASRKRLTPKTADALADPNNGAAPEPAVGTSTVESQHAAILSHVFGPPSPPQGEENTAEANGSLVDSAKAPSGPTDSPEDDPLAHPRPSEHISKQQARTSAQNSPADGAKVPDKTSINGDSNHTDNQADAVESSDVGFRQEAATADSKVASSGGTNIQNATDTTQSSSSSQQRHGDDRAAAVNPQPEDVSTLLPDLELYANEGGNDNTHDDNFNIEEFTSANAFAANGSTDMAGGDQGHNRDFNTDLPVDFLQNGAGDGTSFEEQFDFSAFDFDATGDENNEGNGTSGDAQNWDSNFFDESLFNLDGGSGD